MISLPDSRQRQRSPESIETTARIFRSPTDLGSKFHQLALDRAVKTFLQPKK